ncbi:RagB/SusD family nutrient uptake outer membrane protein [Aquimarina agarivorans]|uniref:RagB/SusD family nutrient uptake outer membrane protein n=1 Tax=Aquimarina agarivorans TaxID=980584 RepID=UPI000248FB3E|nr:RagB/SusD family nutrient uptake outer membrane protein [Aquimarina agarivorans]
MKNKNLYKSFLFVIAIFLFSCDDDLDVQNNNSSDPDVFQSPVERAEQLVFGAYSALQFPGATGGQAAIASAWFSEVSVNPNNVTIPFSTAIGVTDGVYDETDDIAQQMYSDLYRVVNRANNTIATVDKLLRSEIRNAIAANKATPLNNDFVAVNISDFDKENFSEDERKTLLEIPSIVGLSNVRGEALFLRSLALFWLSNSFNGGNVVMPLKIAADVEGTRLPLSSRATVYEQIIKDLTLAKNVYLSNVFGWSTRNQDGRATFGAVASLLGKVLLYDEKFDASADVFQEVVNCASCNYALVDDYESNFKEEGEFNSESVFEVQYSDNLPFVPNFGDGEGTTTNESTIRAAYFSDEQGGFGWFKPSHFIVTLFKNEVRTAADLSEEEAFYEFGENELTPRLFANPRPRLLSKRAKASMAFADDGSLYYGRSTDSQGFSNGTFPTLPRRAVVRKFHNDELTAELQASPLNEKIIRYSDVLLMYAEALLRGADAEANKQQAIELINEVRAKRGLVSLETLFQGVETPPIVDLTLNDRLNKFPPSEENLKNNLPSTLQINEQELTPENIVFHLFDKERPAEFAFEGRGILWNDLRRRPLRNSGSSLSPALERLQELAAIDYELVVPNALDTSPGLIAFIRVNDNARSRFLKDFQRRTQNIQSSFLRSNLYFPIPFVALNENPKLFDNPSLLITD